MADLDTSAHRRAADTFARRVRDEYGDVVESVILFGSVARGNQRGVASDVDLLVVVDDEADRAEYERRIRDLAYDVELERSIVLSVIVVSAAEYRRDADPFLQNVRRDAKRLHG